MIALRVMRSGLFIAFWIIVLAAGGVFAQDIPPLGPISTLEAGDFRALAVTADGDRLLVADAENRQVRVYDFSDPANPALLSSLDVSGTPVLLAGGDAFGLVAVITDDATDAVEVIAPALPGAGAEYFPGSYIDIGKNPRGLALSPDNRWGIAVSEDNYTLLQINAPDNIDSFPVDAALISAALSDDTAYLLHDQQLDAAPLDTLAALDAGQSLPLDGEPSALALNADASAGVVVLDGSQLVFFDPATLEQTNTFTLDGNPITSVHYMMQDDTDFLLITQQASSTIRILNADAPQNADSLTTEAPDGRPLRAVATFDGFMIATDGVTIQIFAS